VTKTGWEKFWEEHAKRLDLESKANDGLPSSAITYSCPECKGERLMFYIRSFPSSSVGVKREDIYECTKCKNKYTVYVRGNKE